jgi:hypothetical protein
MAVSRVRYGRRMIRHVVLFRWTEEAIEEQKQRVAAEIARLPRSCRPCGRFISDPT